MAIVVPPPIGAMPPAPTITNPGAFPAKGDAMVAAFPQFISQTNSAAMATYQNAVDAQTSATTAQAAATSALAVSGATVWNAATNYAQGSLVHYLGNGQTYRCLVAGVNATAPPLNPAKWIPATMVAQFGSFREEVASGVISASPANTSGGTMIRAINVVLENSISGLTLESNTLTFAGAASVGTFDIVANAHALNCGFTRLVLVNVTDNVAVRYGMHQLVQSSSSVVLPLRCRITLTAPRQYQIRQYTSTAYAYYAGIGANQPGVNEVYLQIDIQRVG